MIGTIVLEHVSYTTIGLSLFILSLLHWVYTNYQWNTRYKLPPCVPGVPLLGNSLQVPAVQQGPWAKDLADKYGEMYVTSNFPAKERNSA